MGTLGSFGDVDVIWTVSGGVERKTVLDSLLGR